MALEFSHPTSGTGYGQQTALFVPRIAALGHDVAISCMTGLGQAPGKWEGFTCLPSGYTTYSNDVLPGHAATFFGDGPGLILVLYDAWAVDHDAIRGRAVACWSPVHSEPLSGLDKRFYASTGAQPVAMSRFGEQQMRDFGLQPVYVPHGIDLGTFRPLDGGERDAARDMLGVPRDAFLIAMVAANKGGDPPRKGWGEQFAAFARFADRHPDAWLYVHSMAVSPHGIDIRPLAASLGIEKRVVFSAGYPQVTGLYTPGFVAGAMGCADVLSNCSWGEGFGLATVEAQACGTPVVVADNSAQPELCGAGWKVECQPYWYPADQAWWHPPLVKSIVRAWEKAYKHRGDERLRERAREFAQQYDADLVAAVYWKPVLDMLEQYAGAAPVRVRNGSSVPLPTATSDGLRWIQRGGHTDDWIATGHEEKLGPVLDRMLPDGGVLLDVGAHVGRWSLRMAAKASQVIAVEANPETAAVLRAHLELNDVTNVEVLEAAAWDSTEMLDLQDPGMRVTGGSTRTIPGGHTGTTQVPGVRLDDLLGDVPRIDLVKLDVEGADLHALRGMAGTLRRCRPLLLIERHDVYGYYDLADLTGLLTSLGYGYQDVTIPIRSATGAFFAAYIAATPLPVTAAERVAAAAVRFGASQHEGELAAAVELVTAADPRVVVEIGCDAGGTLYAWRRAAPAADVYGITTADNSYASGGSGLPLADHGAVVYTGDSHDPGSRAWLASHLGARFVDVLVIDGDHAPGGVRQDLAMYGPLVAPGGLILLHDVTPTADPRARVHELWPQLQKRYETSEITRPGGHGWGIIHIREGDMHDV